MIRTTAAGSVFVLIVLLLVFTRASSDELFDCSLSEAAGCDCVAKDRNITCVGSGLTNVPVNLSADPSAIRTLTIRHDRFSGDTLDSPIIYVGLTSLHLDSDGIRQVVPGVFVSLSSLRTLVLANNRLRSLTAGVFDGLVSLTVLDLADNPLYWLDAGVLTADAVPVLTMLDVARCRINDVEVGALTNLSRLRRISATGNRLVHLPSLGPGLDSLVVADFSSNRLDGVLDGSPTLCGASSLEQLLLSDNEIARLSAKSFGAVDCATKLKELVLRNNRLVDVATGAWTPLTAVERLDLSFNELTELNASDLPWDSLSRLLIHDNRWDCSGCSNSWLVDEAAVKRWNTGTDVRCYSPESAAGFDVYADKVFDSCNTAWTWSGDGAGRTTLLVVSAVLVAFIAVVAVVCLCRRQSRQRRRPTVHLVASSTRPVTSRDRLAHGRAETGTNSFYYQQMVDMLPTTTGDRTTQRV